MKKSFAALVFLALALPASAQEPIRLLVPGSSRDAMGVVLPVFEAKYHVKVAVTFANATETRRLSITSDDFDVKIVQPPLADILAKGNVVAASQTLIANMPVALIVRKGTPHPDLSSADSVKKALLAAKSVSYPDPAGAMPVGPSFQNTLSRLGILKEVEAKAKIANGGPAAMENVLKGEADIGIDFLSEASDPGIDMVGALPATISTPPQLVGFVTAKAREPKSAASLLQWLASAPEATAAYRAHGLTPAK